MKPSFFDNRTYAPFPSESVNGRPPAPVPDRPPETGRPRPASIRVLIVDDEPMLRELTATILKRSGYQVVQAENGAEGWKKFRSQPCDLVITDNEMPGLSGLDLLRKIRNTHKSMPCIFASGNVPQNDPEFLSLLKPGTILEKPFTMLSLLTTFEKWVQSDLINGKAT